MSEGQKSQSIGRRWNIAFWLLSGFALLLFGIGFPLLHYETCSGKPSNDEIPGHIYISDKQTTDSARGDENTPFHRPLAVPVNPHQTSIESRAEGTYYLPEEPHSWWDRTVCDARASDYFVGLFTLILAISTIGLWWQTERLAKGADDQSEKMAASIREAGRSATAMEDVAKSLDATTQNTVDTLSALGKQMRAYVTIGNGQLYTQESSRNIRIQMDPAVVNLGLTPARNVTIKFQIGILPFPIPDAFDFTIIEPVPGQGGTLNPRHPYTIAVIADDLFPEELIWKSIVVDGGHKLFVWGTIWYDDVSGERRHQNYCQWCLWKDAGNSTWINGPRHNDGT